jgi:aminoglycoside phosphotransferase (APT) family kinase protein
MNAMLDPMNHAVSSDKAPFFGNRGRLPFLTAGIRNPAYAGDVAAALQSYFRARLGLSNLALAELPVAFLNGWETHSYHFRLQSPEKLPSTFARPLTVRIYCNSAGLPRARREFVVQHHLYQLQYPVAEPLLLEEDCSYFGGPFLIMAEVCGPALLQSLLRRPWKIIRGPVEMAIVHVRLHQLPTEGFPALPGCLLTRRLDEMAAAIRDHGLSGLRFGFDWLFLNRPDQPQDPKIVHLDFHPLNLIEEKNRSLVVLDWNEADLGDRHADVGTTLMLMDCLPGVKAMHLQRLLLRTGRFYFVHKYLSTYRRHLPLDEHKLSYYRALAAFRRLCNYGRWLQEGPENSGLKPAMLQLITNRQRQTLERYFQRWTGVAIRLCSL